MASARAGIAKMFSRAFLMNPKWSTEVLTLHADVKAVLWVGGGYRGCFSEFLCAEKLAEC
jgi:hypothetical protein